MHDRTGQISAFLEGAGWSDPEFKKIAGDMSPRRYSRLTLDGKTAILMDSDQDMTTFVDMSRWLACLGLSVPKIFAEHAKSGLILLEDFGDVSLKSALLKDPSLEAEAHDCCLDVMLRLRDAVPPLLRCPDAQELVTWTKLVDEFVPGLDVHGLEAFRAVLADALESVLQAKPSVSLRDFHSENMMWLNSRDGFRKLGLLDYQDAFLTHPAYDLVSFLTDARTWVSSELRKDFKERYIARTGDDAAHFELAFAALSAQRNLRILGIFARAQSRGEAFKFTYQYFSEALEHPVFADVRKQTLRALPSELATP